MLTGRTPYRNGVFTWIPAQSPIHLRSSEQALPKLLAVASYDTCHASKWHLNGKFNSPDREGDWKIVADESLERPELYNLSADRNETRNLAAQESERLAAMMTRLRAHTTEVEAEGPDWWRTEPLNGRKKTPAGASGKKRRDKTSAVPATSGGGQHLRCRKDRAA